MTFREAFAALGVDPIRHMLSRRLFARWRGHSLFVHCANGDELRASGVIQVKPYLVVDGGGETILGESGLPINARVEDGSVGIEWMGSLDDEGSVEREGERFFLLIPDDTKTVRCS